MATTTKKKTVTDEAVSNSQLVGQPIVKVPVKSIDDPTKQAQAVTKEDVEAQDSRTRLWQSLSQGYGVQKENTEQEYAKAYNQADRQALSRGMGRSSYNNQTLANINEQKIKALSNIDSALIADYQNRIGQLEQQEKEDERWERQFQAGREDAEWQRQYQESRATAQDEQWQKSFDAQQAAQQWQQAFSEKQYEAGREDTAWQQQYQEERAKAQDEQWQREYDERLRQFDEQMAYQKERAGVSDAQWEKTYETQRAEFERQMALQEEQFKAGREDTAWQQAFSEKQFEAQQSQWREEFDYQKMSTQQKLSFEVLMQAAAQGKDVSQELLDICGISKKDYDAMKTEAKKSGGGGGYRTTGPSGPSTPAEEKPSDAGLEDMAGGGGKDKISTTPIAEQSTGSGLFSRMSAALEEAEKDKKKGTSAITKPGQTSKVRATMLQ